MKPDVQGLALEINPDAPERGECVSQNSQKRPSSLVCLTRHPVAQRSAVFGFPGRTVPVYPQPWCWRVTAALDDTQMNCAAVFQHRSFTKMSREQMLPMEVVC